MDSLEPKKLALIRILQILSKNSDRDHPLKQEQIAELLERDFGISVERKAVGRNLSLLREAGYDVVTKKNGSYLDSREFTDPELRILIDGVLSSKYISTEDSKKLVERLCSLSSRYFRANVRHISAVGDWSKQGTEELFTNIGLVDKAISEKKKISFDYNRYGADKKLHLSRRHTASPYQLILRNQRYYLMAFNELRGHISYYRMERISNMSVGDSPLTPLNSVKGYEEGVDYKKISTSLPYMYADEPERVTLIADPGAIDQIVDWFGTDIRVSPAADSKLEVSVKVSPQAMEYWAMQYANSVTVIRPEYLAKKIRDNFAAALERYGGSED